MERLNRDDQEWKRLHDQTERAVDQMNDRHLSETTDLRRELNLLQERLLALTPGRSKRTARSETAAPSLDAHEFDAFYVAFEDQFRGSRAEIKKRTRVYLPYLKEARAGTAQMPILDLGCGRGEWLELLRHEKLKSRGIDLNTFMVEDCVGRGLAVEQADVIAHLATLPAERVLARSRLPSHRAPSVRSAFSGSLQSPCACSSRAASAFSKRLIRTTCRSAPIVSTRIRRTSDPCRRTSPSSS